MIRRSGNYNKRNFSRRPFSGSKPNSQLIRQIRDIQLIGSRNHIKPGPPVEYIPKHSFGDFGLSSKLVENIAFKKYTVPTPVQDQAIPEIMQGRDLIGIANTGTGKTAAFLIPLIEKVCKNKNERVLIITPTRELAIQIFEELASFVKGLGIRFVLCIGGTSIGHRDHDLRLRPNFVVGTPGRLKDLISRRFINLSEFGNVVLDEADRMVDIGFIQVVKYFISLLSKNRQSLFFSATIGAKEREILNSFVHNPVTVSVKTQETAENVIQQVIEISKDKRVDKLHDLLITPGFDKILLFARTKWGVQKLTAELIKRGFKADAIHGNKTQNQRQRVLDRFKNSQIQILLATDLASRGLDIPDVTHVINFDIPGSYEDYVHRIGRTGRANKKGIAITFV